MTDTTEELTNQTLFSNQEPLLQGGGSSSNPVEELTPEQIAAQKKKKKLFTLAGGFGIVLLILVIVLAALSPKRQLVKLQASPTPSPVTQANKTEMQARLDELNDDLTAADPSKLDLSIPPVDMNLTLDPIPRQN